MIQRYARRRAGHSRFELRSVIIAFQNAQIRALLKKVGRKRVLLDDEQRRLLAVKGHAIGRKALHELTTIVTPDTILRWHRKLDAKQFDSSDKRKPGRPRIRQAIVAAIVRFAKDNPAWGYDRIQGALKNLGYLRDGYLIGASHLIVDRDASFIALREFVDQNTDTEIVLWPPKSPNLNSYMERWFRSLKSECLDRMIFSGQRSLGQAVANFVQHYHTERNHQGLDNEIIEPNEQIGSIECRERLGGMLKYYHRPAA